MQPTAEKIPHRLAARRLMRRVAKAALGTQRADGGPYVSLVTVATHVDGTPLLLLSGLAEHSRNLRADNRVSLLFDGTDGFANPQEGPRLTLLGRAEPTDDDRVRRRFLARHPGAALYAGFGDFGFFRVVPERAQWVGGFARALWIEDGLLVDPAAAAAFAEAADGVLAHMNADHAEALDQYAAKLCRPRGRGKGWRMAAIDPDGAELVRKEQAVRLEFPESAAQPGDLRRLLVNLASEARQTPKNRMD